MGKAKVDPHQVVCTKCGGNHYPPKDAVVGNHVGNSGTLSKNVMEECYGGKAANTHPLSSGKGFEKCAQAHHLICSESMKNDMWSEICKNYGYDINCFENGIMLPSDARVACQEKIPLHLGDHDDTMGMTTKKNYVNSVKELIDTVARKIDNKPCTELTDIKDQLNQISKDISFKVRNFNWTITPDGLDYHFLSKKGCMHVMSWPEKGKKMSWNAKNDMPYYEKCPKNRDHSTDLPNKIIEGSYFLEPAAK